VATKVFVNQGHEDKREADRKMKRKVILLAVALAEQSGGPWIVNSGRGRGITTADKQCPRDAPTFGKN
jgi:hypothetical protein